jgi:flagellar biosynthesis/type III secretory pathway chaperone
MTVSTAEREHAATQLFATLHGLAGELLTILTREAQVLSERRHDELDRLSVEKGRIAYALEKATEQQQDLLLSLGYSRNPQGVMDFLAALDETSAAAGTRQRWTEIRELLECCRTLNHSNGATIELFNRHFKRALKILRGQTSAANTYGPDGAERNATSPMAHISV